MGSEDSPFPALVEELYRGLMHAPPWESFLRVLADATGATFATLIIGRGRTIDAHVTPGADPERTLEYQQLSKADPFVGLPEGLVVAFRDFVHHIPAQFRDWMDVSRTGQILGVDLQRGPEIYVRLRLTRDHSRPDFSDSQRSIVERLVPHLRIALDLHARMTTTQAESQLFSSAMADLAVATVILDRKGRILLRNSMSENLMRESGVIADWAGKLEFSTQAAAGLLARLLASPPPTGTDVQVEFAVPDGPPLQGRVRSVPSSAYGDGAWIALFLTSSSRPAGPSSHLLRDRFQLTRAEAVLALQLVDGVALADAARALGITYNTARSHLRAIFAKTGTHRQVELVRLLHTTGSALDI